MLLIKTHLKEISGKGISLFTSEDLKEGQIVYEDCDIFSRKISDELFNSLPSHQQIFVKFYGCYVSKKKEWYLDTDNGRFMNHSEIPNIEYDWGTYLEGGTGTMIALKDIPANTELVSNYRLHSDQYKEGNFDFEIK